MRYSNSFIEPVTAFFREHKVLKKISALIVCCILLLVCWVYGKSNINSQDRRYIEIPENDASFQEQFPYLTVTELDMITELGDVKQVDLTSYSGVLEISEGGDYLLKGKLDGSIIISAKEQNVHLYFEDVEIYSSEGPAIYCKEADKLVITLIEGSHNIVSDSGLYPADKDVESCIYSVCDITLNGSGTMNVNAYYKDALRSRDIVKILEGNLNFKCKRTAVRGNDGVLVTGGNIIISSEKNGLMTTKKGSEGKGNLVISGGELTIIAGRYAFVAEKGNLLIYNCNVNNRSVVDTYNVGGAVRVQKGCVQ